MTSGMILRPNEQHGEINGVAIQVVITCSCRRGTPMLVVFTPSLNNQPGVCSGCGTIYNLGRLNLDAVQGQLNVGLAVEQPKIVVPGPRTEM